MLPYFVQKPFDEKENDTNTRFCESCPRQLFQELWNWNLGPLCEICSKQHISKGCFPLSNTAHAEKKLLNLITDICQVYELSWRACSRYIFITSTIPMCKTRKECKYILEDNKVMFAPKKFLNKTSLLLGFQKCI